MAKKAAKKAKSTKKPERYLCNACGLVVTVDEECGCEEACDIICCGRQMQPTK